MKILRILGIIFAIQAATCQNSPIFDDLPPHIVPGHNEPPPQPRPFPPIFGPPPSQPHGFHSHPPPHAFGRDQPPPIGFQPQEIWGPPQNFGPSPPFPTGFQSQPSQQPQYFGPAQSPSPAFQNPFLTQQQQNPSDGTNDLFTSGRIPSGQDISAWIEKKFRNLFPTPGQIPTPDSDPLFPLPDLSPVGKKCPKDGFFYSFNPVHREAMSDISRVLQGGNSTTELLDIARALKESPDVHPNLWFYTMSSFCQKNPDLQSIMAISPIHAMPDIFIPAEILQRARQGSTNRPRRQNFINMFAADSTPQQQPTSCVLIDETVAADNGADNAMWYFRESIGVNSHHWYYHIMYPFQAQQRADRHGELFYYMHASLVARYNAERLSNGLGLVQPYDPLQRGTPVDGYRTHLQDDNSGQNWSSRPANLPFTDAIRQNDPAIRSNVLVDSHILQARSRIMDAIANGFALNTQNQRVLLNNFRGIDILGDLVLSDAWSINPNYYGSGSPSGFHNNGHLVFAFLADPNYQRRLPPGVMADSAPAMRDVAFYRWHTTTNAILDTHKANLGPYRPTGGDFPLIWPGVSISGVSVASINGGTPNLVRTFWNQQQITLNRGTDLGQRQTPIQICAKVLDRERFSYQFTINKNPNVPTSLATIRIFLAPRFDVSQNRFNMTQQRSLFFVLDTFQVTLTNGANSITRDSDDSALTIPWEQILQELNTGGGQNSQTPYCGCGWPRNLLLPKGTPNGMFYDLFVMVTNGIDDTPAGSSTTSSQQRCRAAPLYCGIANQLYPDTKPMGYPFDRYPYALNGVVVPTLDDYIRGIPNMATTQIRIQFTGQ